MSFETDRTRFLPLTRQEMQQRGWEQPDFICITGDSYVDHPSFGIAVITRFLESLGYRVCIIAQPQKDQDYLEFGTPRLGFMITGGNIDSMVSHYTAAKRKRSDDAYTAGGKAGKRPDYALETYSRAVRRLFPKSAIILGGIEASLRRFAHYDYWKDTVLPSVLVSSQADLLIYGMAELAVKEVAARLDAGEGVGDLTDIRGTCWLSDGFLLPQGSLTCASFDRVVREKTAFSKAFQTQMEEQDAVYGKSIVQQHGNKYLVQNPPMRALRVEEMDSIYALPFSRKEHPSYAALSGVPGLKEVEFSIIHNRGCFGGCNFCAITMHQGRAMSRRSKDSVVDEAKAMTKTRGFKGFIHDVGGPTANFRLPSCGKQLADGVCKNKKCLVPAPCKSLAVSHQEYLDILRELRQLPGVKKVFVRSGIRYDYLMLDRKSEFLKELVAHHVSGQLKVAPEHCSSPVLALMGKPSIASFEAFRKKFTELSQACGKEQYLVPYLMSSHPGATLGDAVELALYLKKNRLRPEQVQDFYPTPGTASTAMFYTGIDPATGKPVSTAKSPEDKALQRALLQYFDPKNHALVRKALVKAGRSDLIGYGADYLVPPADGQKQPFQRAHHPKSGRQYSKPEKKKSRQPQKRGRH